MMKIKNQYKRCWKVFKESGDYMLVALALFCIFIILGFGFPVFFKDEIFEIMRKLVLEFEGLSLFETVAKIFLNNLSVAFFVIFLGVLFGIFPVVATITNGYLLGFVARYSVELGGLSILLRLLPHGIFELPAIIFSIGFGFKLGLGVLFKNKRKNFKKDFFDIMRFFVFIIVPLLVVAAVVEGVLVYYFS